MKQIKFFLDSECSTKRNTCPNKPEWVLYFTVQCALIERYIHSVYPTMPAYTLEAGPAFLSPVQETALTLFRIWNP